MRSYRGPSRDWGCNGEWGMTGRVFGWLGIRNGVGFAPGGNGVDGSSRSVDVMVIDRPGDLGDIAALGLTLAQGKRLVALVQQEIVTARSRNHAARRPICRSRGAACQVK